MGPRARRIGMGMVGAALFAGLGAGPVGSQKRAPGPAAELATSARDPVKELQGRLAQLEQENRALAARVAGLEGALSVTPTGVTLKSAAALKLQAPRIEASAAVTSVSGALKAGALTADSVTAKTISPAAGNVW